MFFKNLYTYCLPEFPHSAAALEEELARNTLQPVSGLSLSSRGWIATHPDGALVHAQGDAMLITLGVESRLLPGAVVAKEVDARLDAIEAVKGFRPGKKMKREIKEQVIAELLPKAFVRSSRVRAMILPGYIVVDASSPGKAEEMIETLRNALNGELPVTLMETTLSPSALMSAWIAAREIGHGFDLGDECELVGTDESKPTAKFSRHGLEGEDVRRHLSEGKQAVKLGLSWADKISFVLTDKLQIKKLKFLAVRADEASEHPADQFDNDFALMSGEVGALLAAFSAAVR